MTPIKKPAAPGVKLVPLLAGHLSMPQWLCQAAGAVLGAPWQACPAAECLMHWHQDVHFVFKLTKEAGEEAAWLRADFTRDVALPAGSVCCQATHAPVGIQAAQETTLPLEYKSGRQLWLKLWGQRLPQSLCSSGNRLSTRTARYPAISTENKATSKSILIYFLQQNNPPTEKKCYPTGARHQ